MSDGRPDPGRPEPGDARPDGPDADDRPDAAASDRLTPGGARLRNRPDPVPQPKADSTGGEGVEADVEPEPLAPEAPAAPRGISLKQYYLGVVLMLVGIGLGLYGFVDIYGARDTETGGLSMVSAGKIALGGALLMFGQNIVRTATNDPRARRRP